MLDGLLATLVVLSACLPLRVDGQVVDDPVSSSQVASINGEEFAVPIGDDLARQIDDEIARLGSPVYQQRQEATDRLKKMGIKAFPQLRDAYRQADELEVRLRIESIIHTAYLNYHVYDRFGFLGVTLAPYTPNTRSKTKLPDHTVGVVVMAVVPGTGADRAGLQPDDVVVAIDDVSLRGPWNQAVSAFAESIRNHRPGTALKLKLYRRSDELTIEAIVGSCPKEQVRSGRVNGIPELLRQANNRFPIWWVEHFRESATPNR